MTEYLNKEEYCKNYCRCNSEYCDRQSCPIWKAPAANVEPVREKHIGLSKQNILLEQCTTAQSAALAFLIMVIPGITVLIAEQKWSKTNDPKSKVFVNIHRRKVDSAHLRVRS